MKTNRKRKPKYRRKKISFYERHAPKGEELLEQFLDWFNLSLFWKILLWIFKTAAAVLLAFVFVWYFGQRVSTVGDSMSPILGNGDVVLVNRFVYNTTSPKRGDIVVFKPNGNENSHYYIKRIVGLPGESVEIIENRIYINGERLEEDYETTKIDDVGIITEKTTLTGEEYFVLGDDRENSEDSRNADVGMVKKDYIFGKVWLKFSPKLGTIK